MQTPPSRGGGGVGGAAPARAPVGGARERPWAGPGSAEGGRSGSPLAGLFALFALPSSRCYSPHGAYARSKLALVLFTYHLQRLLAAQGCPVTANAADPGVVDTGLYRHVFWGTRLVKKLFGRWLFKVSPGQWGGCFWVCDLRCPPPPPPADPGQPARGHGSGRVRSAVARGSVPAPLVALIANPAPDSHMHATLGIFYVPVGAREAGREGETASDASG